jgi:hypothetical protein
MCYTLLGRCSMSSYTRFGHEVDPEAVIASFRKRP